MNSGVRESLSLVIYASKWTLLSVVLGMLVGSACALFLWSLDWVTSFQFSHPMMLWLLPVAGAGIAWMYGTFGRNVERGNNLIVEEIHAPGGGVPLRMAPLVLIGTLVTHLFGGSAGREGTAVQMGGSLASGLARMIPRLSRDDVRTLLMAGVSSGFAGVFGTPVAGTVFAMEVLTIGRMNYAAILPCLIAAVISDQVCLAWGIGHTHYHVASRLPTESASHLASFDLQLVLVTAAAGAAFGLTSRGFAKLTHTISGLLQRWVARPILRPVFGGLAVIALVQIAGTRDFLGLGVTSSDVSAVTIVTCFQAGGADTWSWLWKLILTAVTLGSGFKGGEVTPLFFIGAALGHTLAVLCGAPVDLFAALGFVSVFAGATNTPLACIVMSVELFGGEYLLYFALSCVMAYLFSGHSGIYSAQKTAVAKPGRPTNSQDDESRG